MLRFYMNFTIMADQGQQTKVQTVKGIIRHKNFFLGFPAKLSYCNHNCWRMHFFPEISMPYLCEHKFFIFQSTALLSQNTALYKLNNSSAAAD